MPGFGAKTYSVLPVSENMWLAIAARLKEAGEFDISSRIEEDRQYGPILNMGDIALAVDHTLDAPKCDCETLAKALFALEACPATDGVLLPAGTNEAFVLARRVLGMSAWRETFR